MVKIAEYNRLENAPSCSICGAIMPDCGPNAVAINYSDIKFCYCCGHPVTFTEKSLGPENLSFKDENEYYIWLNNNTHFIPRAGKVYCVKIKNIDKSFLKIGNDLDFFSELPEVRNYDT